MNKTLKVRYVEWPPWAQDVRVGNGTVLTGVMKDVFDILSYSLNSKLDIQSQEDHQFGSLQGDGSFNGMLGALQRKEVDIAGPLVASEQRAAVADFTNCLEFSKLGIITGLTPLDRNMFLYAHVFSWQVWMSLLLAIILTAFTAALIYNVSLQSWCGKQISLLSQYLWVFWSNLIGHGVGSTNNWTLMHIWNLPSFRILLASWLLGVINVLLPFQGSITSTFVISKMAPVVSDLDELTRKTNVIPVITKGSAVQICFMTSKDHEPLWRRMQNHSIVFSETSLKDTLLKVEKGTHVLIVDYVYALGIATKWIKNTGKCSLQVEEILFCRNFITLALKKGSHANRIKEINSKLTYIIQAKLKDHWMKQVYANYTHCTKQPLRGSKPLSIEDILGGLIIWGIGLLTSFMTLLVEIFISGHHRS